LFLPNPYLYDPQSM